MGNTNGPTGERADREAVAHIALGTAVHRNAVRRLFDLWPEALVEVAHYSAVSQHPTMRPVPLRVTVVTIESAKSEDVAVGAQINGVEGKARCRLDTDNYDRRYGIDLAFRRALRRVKEVTEGGRADG